MTDETFITIPDADLRDFAAALLHAGGFGESEAEMTARSLVLSDLKGYASHGVIRVIEYLGFLNTGEVAPGAQLEILNDTPTSVHADAHRGLGQVQMPRLLDMLADKAGETGTATLAARNCGHVGRLGEWAEYLAERGLAGLVFVNDNGALHCVAPPGGKEARTSTNPVAFGVPLADGRGFIVDFATSAVAIGKMRLAHLAGEACAPGLIQDADGNPSTDPAVLFEDPKGALLPFGGYKGFALSMMVDCLAAGLSGGFTPPAPDGVKMLNNVLVTAWNPESFAGLEHMREQAEKYLGFVRSTPPTDADNPVRAPGDRANAEMMHRLENGVPLAESAAAALRRRAEELGVAAPHAMSVVL